MRNRLPAAGWRDVPELVLWTAGAGLLLGVGHLAVVAGGLPFHAGLAAGTVLGMGGLAVLIRSRHDLKLLRGTLGVRGVLVGLLAGTILGLLSNTVMALLVDISPALEALAERRAPMMESILLPEQPEMLPVVLLVAAILPGLFEELLFRGAFRERFLRRSTAWRLVWISVVFSALHADLVALLPLFGVGLLLGLAAERTGGWAFAAVLHVAHNGAAILIAVWAVHGAGHETAEEPELWVMAGLVILLATALAVVWNSAPRKRVDGFRTRNGVSD